jgi:hypothetical protein
MGAFTTTCGQSPAITRAAAEPNQPQKEAAVLRLASRGLRLFPVDARGKRPLVAD